MRTTDEGRRRLTERARRQDCNVGDYVIIKGENEDGEEEDWFGQARDDKAPRDAIDALETRARETDGDPRARAQIKAKVAQNELATVKFLQKCENLEEFIDEVRPRTAPARRLEYFRIDGL